MQNILKQGLNLYLNIHCNKICFFQAYRANKHAQRLKQTG